MVTIIAAIAENRALGLQGDLLYYIKPDLQRFKQLTTGHTIIMGRRTFESLPKGALPHRRNIVLSQREGLTCTGAEVFPSLSSALAACTDEASVFIIGGASVYAEALPQADRLELTHVLDTPTEADVFFPEVDWNEWELIFEERHEGTPTYIFATYQRR